MLHELTSLIAQHCCAAKRAKLITRTSDKKLQTKKYQARMGRLRRCAVRRLIRLSSVLSGNRRPSPLSRLRLMALRARTNASLALRLAGRWALAQLFGASKHLTQ